MESCGECSMVETHSPRNILEQGAKYSITAHGKAIK